MMMKVVIVLISFIVQVISQVCCEDALPQFFVLPHQFFPPSCLPKPGPPPPPTPPPQPDPPLPSCPCSGGPGEGQSPPIIPCEPQPDPPNPEPCPCCKPPTGALALLLDVVANLMNLPKGSLSSLPLCCSKDVNLPRQLLAGTIPLSRITGSGPSQKKMTLQEIQALINLLKTPQAISAGPSVFMPRNLNVPQFSNFPAPILQAPNFPPQFPYFPLPPQCITHRLEPNIIPGIDQGVRTLPVYQNTICTEEEQTTTNVPIVEKTFTSQEEHVVRQVPVVRKFTRPVVETRTRHIPVIRKRIRTVVEPYTSHIPVLEKFTHPVEETFISTVPVVERRCRPIVTQTLAQVPVIEKRLRPVVQSHVTQVPVKQQVVKHFFEHRVKPYLGPCEHCGLPSSPLHHPFPFPPTFLNVPGTPSFPCHQ